MTQYAIQMLPVLSPLSGDGGTQEADGTSGSESVTENLRSGPRHTYRHRPHLLLRRRGVRPGRHASAHRRGIRDVLRDGRVRLSLLPARSSGQCPCGDGTDRQYRAGEPLLRHCLTATFLAMAKPKRVSLCSFGLSKKFGAQFCPSSTAGEVQSRKYNGKELDKMHGLNTYDYGARQYNPSPHGGTGWIRCVRSTIM